MKQIRLRQLIFMALCRDVGLFAKKLILPAANLVAAVLTAREAGEEGRAYLMREDGERPYLLVTGDPNSKRQVRGVARMEVE